MLAVTFQNPGDDGIEGTADDVTAPLNRLPADVSVDVRANDGCGHPMDRVRNFVSPHTGGGFFLLGDGSVRFVADTIDYDTYKLVSRMNDGQVQREF